MSREMPNAVSLEQSVLGSLMVYPKVIQDCQELDLHAEEFYLPSHQQIYQAICTIHENGQPIDMNTVVNRLQESRSRLYYSFGRLSYFECNIKILY